MPRLTVIQRKIHTNYQKISGGAGANDRFRSWEHCYDFFQRWPRQGISANKDIAALQLGFYLASWGMYRGSSFLLQFDYTAHLAVVECLRARQFAPLWKNEFGAADGDRDLVPIILDAVKAVRNAYGELAKQKDTNATDTLVTKVMLGTVGCLPACDQYFRAGVRKEFRTRDLKFSRLNEGFVVAILKFCHEHREELQEEQLKIEGDRGKHYPLMKLIDMYFWQIGCGG